MIPNKHLHRGVSVIQSLLTYSLIDSEIGSIFFSKTANHTSAERMLWVVTVRTKKRYGTIELEIRTTQGAIAFDNRRRHPDMIDSKRCKLLIISPIRREDFICAPEGVRADPILALIENIETPEAVEVKARRLDPGSA